MALVKISLVNYLDVLLVELFLRLFCLFFDLLETLLAEFHHYMDLIVFNPAVEVSNNMRAFRFYADSA